VDIEGLLVDTKPIGLELMTKHVPAGEPIHQMRLRMTVDRERLIVDMQAVSEVTPYHTCVEVASTYQRLIGLRIEPGFTQQVKRLFRGVEGCTHMTELLPAMASTAFQVLWADGDINRVDPQGSTQRSSPLGGCHALRLDGTIVKTYFPDHYKGPDA
jgi:hypothetical protein